MLKNQRAKFSLPQNITFLNCAYMSPLLKSVEKAGMEGIKTKRNPLGVSSTDFFTGGETLRKEFSRIINNPDPKRIAIIPSVSYGIANVVKNVRLNAADNIIVAAEQFPSNYYPWQKLCKASGAQLKVVAPPLLTENRGKVWNEALLEAIDKNTRVVALGNVHWADGTRFDLPAIRKRTREQGSLLIIDGTQSVGALPFDVRQVQPDALICAGYKWLLGPYSIGMAFYGPYFDEGNPVEENWINRLHSEDFAALVNYEASYQPGALRYEVGEHSNFILVPMMIAALQQISQWKPEGIQEYCASITRKPIAILREAGCWVEDEGYRGHHLFGVRLPKKADLKKIKNRLAKNKIAISFRGDAIRVAPHLYNEENDLMRLVRVLTN